MLSTHDGTERTAATPAVATGPTPRIGATATATAGPDAFERSGRITDLRLTLPPAGTARPYPLVVALHSLFHLGTEPKREWGFDALAATHGFAVAYPDGVSMSWNAGSCCEAAAATGVDDVGWLRSLIAHLAENYPVDRRRVYVVGFSNGGMLAYRYACEHGDELAGVGVVAGSVQVAPCLPPAPVNVVAVHGLEDLHTPYNGMEWSDPLRSRISSGTESLAPFRTVAGCSYPDELGEIVFTDSSGGIPAASATGTNGEALGSAPGTPPPAAPAPPGFPAPPPAAVPAPPDAAAPAPPPPAAARRQTPCFAGSTIVEYLIPHLGHRWPPATGPGAFETARVIWATLAPGRSHVAVPRM